MTESVWLDVIVIVGTCFATARITVYFAPWRLKSVLCGASGAKLISLPARILAGPGSLGRQRTAMARASTTWRRRARGGRFTRIGSPGLFCIGAVGRGG